MIVDAHSHILSLAEDPEFTLEYGREGSLCIYRSMGLLPSHRMPTEDEWEASGYTRKGWPVIGPSESLRDHPGFDKVVVLAISPQLLDGRLIGTVDTTGELGLGDPMHPDRCNDYVAAVVRSDPERFIGFASVNPAYRGVGAAVEELRRAVTELGLAGVKLYPMYQHWAANDPDLAFPIYRDGAGSRHPRDDPPGGLDADRREARARPSGDARRHRPRVPRPARDRRALRAPVGRRGAVPAHEAPELLHGALVPDRDADPAGPLPAALALRADVRPAGEAVLRHRLSRGSSTTR